MKQIYANNFKTLEIGRKGENLARQVVFDIRDLESLYGSGTVEVIYQRPGDELPYPVAVQRDGTLVSWTITATDTEMAGSHGKCELRYYVGETLAKSKIWLTWVEPAMDTPSETAPPDPEKGWVDQIIAVGAAAKASADAAKADADRASELAAQAAEKAAQTAQDASDAAKAMEAAQTAQRLAEEAQGAAEAARTAAAAAQAAAEQSATDAAGAKQDAETALKSAQDAAAAAAKVLADIRALYQEMQTWAQGVIQDVNDAGSVAVRSVQTTGDAQVQRVTAEGTRQTANAKAQADAAAQSADSAAQSAQQAAESASAASTSKTNAKASEESAKASETAAQASQTAAAGSASAAANSATSASASASAASESASAAAASATAAKASEEAAKASETAAKASETAAAGSASAAQQSATSAAESAAVYDNVVADVTQLKQDLANKLPKSPVDWEPWTAEEQAAARDRIGIDKPFELIEEIVCDGEATAYTRTVDVNGNPYNLLSVYIEFEIETGNSYTSYVYFRAYDVESNTVLYDGNAVNQKKYVSYLLGGVDAKNGMYQGWMSSGNIATYNDGGSNTKRINRRAPIISPIKKIYITVGGGLKFLSGDKIRIYGVRA